MKYNFLLVSILSLGFLSLGSCSDKDLGPTMKEAQLATSVSLNVSDPLPLALGMKKQIVVTIHPDSVLYPNLSWTSSLPKVASVDQNGNVTASALGSSMITISQVPNLATLKQITVNVMPVATNMLLNPISLYKGTTKSASMELTPSDAYNVFDWTSSDITIAKVDSDGNIKGISPGEAVITAKTLDGSNLISQANVLVKDAVPIKSFTLSALGYDLSVGDVAQLYTTFIPTDATAELLSWTSSDPKVATVSETGSITAVGNGITTITATSNTGISHSVTVTVGVGAINQSFTNSMGQWTLSSNATATFDGTCMTVHMATGTKYRADLILAAWNDSKTVNLNVGTYRYLAIKMIRPGTDIQGWNGNGTVVLDTSHGRYLESVGSGNNEYSVLGYDDATKADPTQPQVMYFDLQKTFGGSKYSYPTMTTENISVFSFVIADIPVSFGNTYKVYWVHTFKTLDEMKAFVGKE